MRNFIATMMLSQGVPMIAAGDEFANSQMGNNNAYCQDNSISWLDWRLNSYQEDLQSFTRHMVFFRKEHLVLTRKKFFQGRNIRSAESKDAIWLESTGREMTDESWEADFIRCFGLQLHGCMTDEVDQWGDPVVSHTLLLYFNAHSDPVEVTLPDFLEGVAIDKVIDTSIPRFEEERFEERKFLMHDRSIVVFRQPMPGIKHCFVPIKRFE
jgi:glycogen operon protein